MRKALLPLLLLAGVALAAGLTIDNSSRLELTNCAAGGNDGGTANQGVLAEGQYLLRVTDSDVFLCWQNITADGGYPTCTTGGEKFPSGTVLLQSVPRSGYSLSCRSTATSGDVILTRVQ